MNVGLQSDLWMYDMQSGFWTWLNGHETSDTRKQAYAEDHAFSPENSPGSRNWCSMTYDTSTDSLILYGGYVDNIGIWLSPKSINCVLLEVSIRIQGRFLDFQFEESNVG